MSSYAGHCPNCGSTMEKRTFIDTWDPDGKPCDISKNWWCPVCRLRWLSLDFEPEEAEGRG